MRGVQRALWPPLQAPCCRPALRAMARWGPHLLCDVFAGHLLAALHRPWEDARGSRQCRQRASQGAGQACLLCCFSAAAKLGTSSSVRNPLKTPARSVASTSWPHVAARARHALTSVLRVSSGWRGWRQFPCKMHAPLLPAARKAQPARRRRVRGRRGGTPPAHGARQVACGAAAPMHAALTGLLQNAQRMAQPCRKTTKRTPGPSTALNDSVECM